MNDRETNFQVVPDAEIDPQIASVLEPGEQVYWQARPKRGGIGGGLILLLIFGVIAAWAGGIRDMQAAQEVLRDFGDTVRALWEQLPWAFALFALLPIGLAIGYWPRQERYALTDRRVFKLRSGKLVEQAPPEKLMTFNKSRVSIGTPPTVGDVKWTNAETYERNEREYDRKTYVLFRNVPDPDEVHRMLEDWRQQWLDARNREAAASGEAFRRALAESEAPPGNAPDSSRTPR